MISQANLCNFIYAMREHINFAAGRKLLMMAPISFDLSISETLLPLASGTTVIIATQDEQRDPVAFNDCLIRNNISMLHCTPSRLNAFLKDKSQLDWIKVVEDLMIGGEEFTPQLFTEVKQLYAGRLFNLYGPTEATVWATCKDLTHSNVLTIGSPLNNYTIYILDQEGRPASVEEVGELCIGGKGVALGYINNPELTASKFVDDPITGKGMIYKTGDLAKWTAEGEVNFLGRSDFQIKIRGFRVELGEIHKAVSSFTELQQVEIVVKSNGNGDKFICCYYISEKDLDEPALRQHLGLSLPEYMVPTFYKRLSVFPLTFNGKIDRSALPFEMDEPQVQVDESFGGQLREIWEDVLGRKLASPDEDFIEAGGHSLSAVILLARINDVYKVRIPLGQFFQAPTISGLAETIKGVPVA
jgi:acyl-coenzyme A synthetase/AMP-(fatty) acid ligase/acyl carrier protein